MSKKKTTESIPIAPQPWPPVKPKSRTKVRFITAIISLTMIATLAIGANAASLSFFDSVKSFFGLQVSSAATSTGQTRGGSPFMEAIADRSEPSGAPAQTEAPNCTPSGTTLTVPGSFATIQAAVNAANPSLTSGDTISLAAATTYTEQLAINKCVFITGAGVGSTIIQSPLTPLAVSPVSGVTAKSVIEIRAGAAVSMTGLTVTGPVPFDGVDLYGIFVIEGAKLTMSNSRVTNIRKTGGLDGVQGLNSVRAGSVAFNQVGELDFNNVTIDDYQKTAVIVSRALSNATITNSTISGAGPQAFTAQNGIQVSGKATATVTGSAINGNYCDNPACSLTNYYSYGILGFDSGAVTVTGNTFDTNDAVAYNWAAGVTSTFTNNTITNVRYAGFDLDDGTANLTLNTITGNATGPNYGVTMIAYDAAGGAVGDTVANLQRNIISGVSGPSPHAGIRMNDLELSDGFENLLTANYNYIAGQTTAITNNDPAVPAEATNNFWGCNGGPNTAGCGTATGESVTPYIQFRAAVPTTVATPSSIDVLATSTVSTNLRYNSDGVEGLTAATRLPDGVPVAFNVVTALGGSFPAPTVALADGLATRVFTANGTYAANVNPIVVTPQVANATDPVTITVNKIAQIISVSPNAPTNAVYNSSFSVGATSDSLLPVTITGSGACSGTGITTASITMISGTGTCTVTYSQAGNNTFASASTTESVNAQPLTITASIVAPDKEYDGNDSSTFTCSLASVVPADVPNVVCSGGTATFDGTGVGPHTVTATGLGLTGSAASNYVLSSTSATDSASIFAKTVTPAIVAPDKEYDGGVSSTFTCSLTGVIMADVGNVVCSGGTATFDGANVGPHTVTATGLGLTGSASGNYVLSSTSATDSAAIFAKTVTPTIVAPDKVYDGNTSSTFTCSLGGVIPADIGNVVCSGGTATFDGPNVGPHTVTATGLGLTGSAAVNYVLSSTSASDSAAITQATPTAVLSISNSPTVFDTNPHTPAVYVLSSSVPGTAQNPSVSNVSAINVYPTTADFVPTDSVNYATINLSAGDFAIVAGTQIVERPTTATWTMHEDTSPEFDYATDDFVDGPGPDPSAPRLGFGSARFNSPASPSKKAMYTQMFNGLKLVDITTLKYATYIGSGSDISLQFNADFDGDNDWQGRALFVPNPGTPGVWQDWDALNPAHGVWYFTGSGAAPAPNLCPLSGPGCSLAFVKTTYPNLRVSSNPLLGALLFRAEPNSVAYLDNFRIGVNGNGPVAVANTFSTFDFEQATSSVTINCNAGGPFIYTGSPITPTPCTASYTTSDGLSGSATISFDPDNINAGPVLVTGTYDGDDNHAGSTATDNFVIQKATPNIVWADPANITYGTALSAAQLNAATLPVVAGSFAYAPPAGTVLNAGNAQILSTTFTPADTNNYNSVSDTAQINVLKKSLTVTAGSPTIIYNAPDPVPFPFSYTLADFVSGEGAGDIDMPPTCDVTGAAPGNADEPRVPGSYQTSCTGGSDNNYQFAFATGAMTVSFCPTISMPTISSPANVEIDVDVTISEVTAEDIGGVNFTFVYDAAKLEPVFTANPLDDPTLVTATAGATVAAGWSISANETTPGTIVVTMNDPGSSPLTGNGVLATVRMKVKPNTTPTTNSVLDIQNVVMDDDITCITEVDGELDIVPAATTTTVTSSHPSPGGAVYGTLVTFTATVSSIPTPSSEGTVDFAIANDSGEPACTGVPVDAFGVATCQRSFLNVANSPHSVVATYVPGPIPNYLGSTSAPISQLITPKAVTVTANDKSKTYGDLNPAFDAVVVGQVPGGDVINYTLGTTATQFTGIGTYAITVTLGSNPNYTVTPTNGTLTINPAIATVTADNKTKFYGQANPPLTATETGEVVGGDALNYTLATVADTFTGIGTYAITVTLGSNPNYTVTPTNGTLTINPAIATVTADNKTKFYGQANPPLTATETGEVVGGDALDYTLATVADTFTGIGTYAITVTLGSNPNYTVTPTNGTLTINPAIATVTADNKTKFYGQANPPLTATETGEVVGGDALNYTLATVADTFTGIGTYAITVTLGSNPNYTVTPTNGTLTINPAIATVTADNKTKVYGQVNPLFTATETGEVVGGDALNYTLSTSATQFSNVGNYVITVALGSNPNYTVTPTNGTLSITEATANCSSIAGYTVPYDGAPHTATGLCLGVQGETLAGLDLSQTTRTVPGVTTDPWTFTDVTGNYFDTSGTVVDTINSGTVSGRVLLAIPFEGSAPVPSGSPTPTPTNIGVPNVDLSANQTLGTLDFSVSTNNTVPADYGKYVMSNFATLPFSFAFFGAGEYTVSPYKVPQPCTYPSPNEFDPPNGISSADASAVSRHIIGVAPLSQSALKAADVSDNAVVSAFDAGLIARKVAGICVPPNTSGEWRFVSLSSAGTPGPGPQNPNTVYSDLINQTYTNENYKAYMMGDVNGTWNPNQADATPDRPTAADPNGPVASLPRVSVMPGGIITVPFSLNNLKGRGVENYQFDVVFDPEIVEPNANGLAVELGGTMGQEFTVVSNVARPGLLKVVVYGAGTAIGDGVYANLKFSAKGGLGSVSMLQIQGFQFNDGKVGVNTVDGSISLSQASDGDVISGRVLTPGGQSGLRNARVTVTSDSGEIFAATTGTFGYFQIGQLTRGRTYTVAVESRRFRFTPVSVALVDNLAPIDLIGQE